MKRLIFTLLLFSCLALLATPPSVLRQQMVAPSAGGDYRIGLVLEYSFNGNANDTSGSGNNGTLTGTGTYGAGLGGFQKLNLAGGHVNTASVVNATDFTICAWVRSSSWTSYLLAGGNAYNDGGYLLLDGSIIQLDCVFGSAEQQVVSFSASGATWYFVAVTKSGATSQFFVNGVQVGTDQTWSSASYAFGLGAVGDYTGGSGFAFQGDVQDFRMYDHALTLAQVVQVYNGGTPFQ